MASDFGQKGLIPDAVKNPPIACDVRARKIGDSKGPVVGRQQFTMGFVSGENFSPFQRHVKTEERENRWYCHLSQRDRNRTLAIEKYAS